MRYRFAKKDINVKQVQPGFLILSVLLNDETIKEEYWFCTKRDAINEFQKEFGTYQKDHKPIAVYPLSNFGGLAIMDIENRFDIYVYVVDNYGDGYKNLTKNKVYYNEHGKMYFVRYGKRYYLDNFMKV